MHARADNMNAQERSSGSRKIKIYFRTEIYSLFYPSISYSRKYDIGLCRHVDCREEKILCSCVLSSALPVRHFGAPQHTTYQRFVDSRKVKMSPIFLPSHVKVKAKSKREKDCVFHKFSLLMNN